jgi:hypothetical protein
MEETKEELPIREEPVMDKKIEGLKIKTKPKPKKLVNVKQEVPKIDLKKTEDAIQESRPNASNATIEGSQNPESSQKVVETVRITETETKQEEEGTQIIEEITNEEPSTTVATPTPIPEPVSELPEGVNKLVDFMKETGGDMQDYIRLNADYSNIDDVALLKEYYKNTKPHLDAEEIEFILDDKFAYDVDYDEEKDVRKKKLAIKEEVVKANAYLEDLKSKYYEEIKLRPGVTQEQQKAMDFFNRHNDEQAQSKIRHTKFITNTKNHFSEDFKGFEFNLGEKRFRYNVTNPSDVANQQSDITNFVKMFLNEDGSVRDFSGYHKAIYAARNADAIATHFYEQGKADAVKNVISQTKNIDNSARSSQPTDHVYLNGLRVKAVSGVDGSKLKIKTRK